MKKLILIALLIPSFNLAAQQRLLQKDSLERDIHLLYRMLDEVHPGTYRYLKPEELETTFRQLFDRLPETLSEGDFMIRLAQTVSKVKCGHTFLSPWNMDGTLRTRLFDRDIYFPIGIAVIDGRFFVTENISGHSSIERGAEILSMNGVAMATVYDSLKTVAKTDGNNTASVDSYFSVGAYDWQAFELYYSLFFPATDGKVRMQFRNFEEDTVQEVTLQLLSKTARSTKMNTANGGPSQASTPWKLTMLDEERALLRIGTFAIWNWKDFNYKTWLKQTFAKLEETGVETLIVDIRGNGGGDSDARDELLSYLVKSKLKRKKDTRALIRTTKIPEDLHPYCNTWVEKVKKGLPKWMYKPFDERHYELRGGTGKLSIKPKKQAFGGKVYIFGNGSNTSATYTMLLLAKTYGFATFVGSESGGNLQGINGSQYVFFYLPYSQMEVDIPLIYTQPTTSRPDRGVKPDIEVKITQRDIALGRDPFLEGIR